MQLEQENSWFVVWAATEDDHKVRTLIILLTLITQSKARSLCLMPCPHDTLPGNFLTLSRIRAFLSNSFRPYLSYDMERMRSARKGEDLPCEGYEHAIAENVSISCSVSNLLKSLESQSSNSLRSSRRARTGEVGGKWKSRTSLWRKSYADEHAKWRAGRRHKCH